MASSLTTIVMTAGDMSAASLESVINFGAKKEGTLQLADFITSMAAGVHVGSLVCNVGSVQASGTFTVSSTGPTNNETAVVAGTTITAKTSGAVPASGEFNINATASVVATGMALAINSVAALSGIVTAAANGAVVTVTAVIPGVVGNGLVLSDAMTNVATVSMAGGSNGTAYTLDNA